MSTIDEVRNLKSIIFPRLKELGVKEVEATFSGSGDSGCVEQLTFNFLKVFEDTRSLLESSETGITYENISGYEVSSEHPNNFVTVKNKLHSSIRDACEELIFQAIDLQHAGWENNEGASGTVVFDIEENEICIDIDVYYVESDSFHYTV